MRLTLVYGPAGSGKTRYCRERIVSLLQREPLGPPVIYLVPEETTFAFEYALMTRYGLPGTMRLWVTGFRRLARRVLTERGWGKGSDPYSRFLLVYRLLRRLQPHLTYFRSVAASSVFAEKISYLLAELSRSQVEGEQLAQAAAEAPDPARRAKFRDLALLYREYEKELEGIQGGKELLEIFCRKGQDSPLLAGAEVVVDGFYSFTPLEREVLRLLLRRGKELTVTVPLPGGEEMAGKLKEMARAEGAEVEEIRLEGEGRFAGRPALSYLARALSSYVVSPWAGEAEGITWWEAPGQREEVERTAAEILRLVREEGYRFREIMVVLSDEERYGPLVEEIFRDAGISFFLDRPRRSFHHPLTRLLVAALAVAAGEDEGKEIFRFLRTGLGLLDQEETDRLENYVLAQGIDGEDWRRVWPEEEMEELRQRATGALFSLKSRLQAITTFREGCQALASFLADLDLPQQLQALVKKAKEKEDLTAARELELIGKKIFSRLRAVEEILGAEKVEVREFASFLIHSLGGIMVRLVPPALDQVLVGSPDRLAAQESRAVFVLGACQGVLPALPETGLLSAGDRDWLRKKGFRIPTLQERLAENRLVACAALTRAWQKLYLSYPLADSEGRRLFPSPLFTLVRETFPANGKAWPMLADSFLHRRYTLQRFAVALREPWREEEGVYWKAFYNAVLTDEELKMFLPALRAGLLFGEKVKLSPEVAGEVYSPFFQVTQVETYFQCPFAHFLRYGLRLREREQAGPDAARAGTFLHRSVAWFTASLRQQGRRAKELADGELEQMADAALAQFGAEFFGDRTEHRYLEKKMRRLLLLLFQALRYQDGFSQFTVRGEEVEFGPGKRVPPLTFTLADGREVGVSGRVDRVDSWQDEEGRLYLRVVDYKSTAKRVRMERIYYGLDLQLPLYLKAIVAFPPGFGGKAKEVLPAALFYFNLSGGKVKDPKGGEEQLFRNYRLEGIMLANREVVTAMDRNLERGGNSLIVPASYCQDGSLNAVYANRLFSRDEMNALLEYAARLFVRGAEEIMAGQIEIAPCHLNGWVPCLYCSYPAVCGYEPAWERERFRVLRKLEEGEARRRITGVGKNGDDEEVD